MKTRTQKTNCRKLIQAAILSGAAMANISTPVAAASLEVCMKTYNQGDFRTAATMFEKLATKGNSTAQRLLASMYMQGNGVRKDPDKAVALYRKAAHNGDTESAFRLGIIYMNGVLVEEDESQAMDWLEKAALNGHKQARVVYSKLLDNDFGIGC